MRSTYTRPNTPFEPFTIIFTIEGEEVDEQLMLEPVSDGVWILRESPVFCDEASYGDTIRTERTTRGDLRYLGVVERSGLRFSGHWIPPGFAYAHEFREVVDRLVELGGQWECVYGGKLMLHTPEQLHSDIMARLGEALVAYHARHPNGLDSSDHRVARLAYEASQADATSAERFAAARAAERAGQFASDAENAVADAELLTESIAEEPENGRD